MRAYAPEVLVLSPCGAGLEAGVQQAAELAVLPGWWALPAVRSSRVFVVDHSLFSRPGPRRASLCTADHPLQFSCSCSCIALTTAKVAFLLHHAVHLREVETLDKGQQNAPAAVPQRT